MKGTIRVTSEAEIDIEKIWIDIRCEESVEKDCAVLYNNYAQVTGAVHVDVGFNQEFSFTIKLPSVGRETYHSVHQNVQWIAQGCLKVKGIKQVIQSGRLEILIKKPVASIVQLKEVVREVVLIPCNYCSGLMPQTSTFCPNCGARRKS